MNRNLFFGVLRRSNSFAGSDLSAADIPAGERERMLLGPYPDAVRPEILNGQWQPPSPTEAAATGSLPGAPWGSCTTPVGFSKAIPCAAGTPMNRSRSSFWSTRDSRSGLLSTMPRVSPGSASKRGLRLVDDAQYRRRLGQFDFGMIQWIWPSSASPGNEQRNRWSEAAASRPGSLNYTGASSPAIDGMIDAMLAATTREDFVAAVRALDRVLLSGFYVVPLFYLPDQWLAYDAGLKRPDTAPLLGSTIDVWWRQAR